jgi:hypothetical protein
MIRDILILADEALEISSATQNVEEYCLLNDGIINTIERYKIPVGDDSKKYFDLNLAQGLLRRLRKRDLYRCVDQVLIPTDLLMTVTKNDFSEGFKSLNMRANSFFSRSKLRTEINP